MKYKLLIFNYNKFSAVSTDSLNGFKKDKLHSVLNTHKMYVDADKLEVGQKRFKKALLKYYTEIINKINE
jgi:hypothetical protein